MGYHGATMAKQPTEQHLPSWAVYHIEATKFVGLVHNQPDAESAIKAAIKEYKIPVHERSRLMALRRD